MSTDAPTAAATTHAFQSEVRQVLQLVIHSLYSNKDIVLRDLETGEVLATLLVGIEPEGVTLDPGGRFVYYYAHLDGYRPGLREGQPLSAPFAATNLFPSMVIHMLDIGEESGRLSEMMVKIADFYEQEVDSTIKGLTSMIEPMLIVLLGGIVGFIAISIMMPMFKLINAIQ